MNLLGVYHYHAHNATVENGRIDWISREIRSVRDVGRPRLGFPPNLVFRKDMSSVAVRKPYPCGGGFVPRNLVALQLASDLLEEPGCTVCEGSSPHITRIGIAAETSIFPESDPVARIHFVFRIDQILQSLQVDFPSGLLHRLGDT